MLVQRLAWRGRVGVVPRLPGLGREEQWSLVQTLALPAPCALSARSRSYSPHILEMKVTDSLPVRRAKLYYLRDRKMNRL